MGIKSILVAILGGLGAMLGWGLSDFFAKKAVDRIGHILALFWMQFLGIVPLLIFFLLNFDTSNFGFSQIPSVVFLGIIDVMGYLMFYKALEKGKVSIVSPITASYAAFSVLISVLVFGEQLSGKVIAILSMIFIGIILTTIDLDEFKKGAFDVEGLTRGVPEALLAVALFAVWFPFWDNFVSDKNWLVLVILLRFVMSLFLLGISKANKLRLKIKDVDVIKWLVIIGILDAIAYLSLTWGYGVTQHTSIISMLSATFSLPTLILARIFLKERLKPNQVVGIGLILLSLALLGLV